MAVIARRPPVDPLAAQAALDALAHPVAAPAVPAPPEAALVRTNREVDTFTRNLTLHTLFSILFTVSGYLPENSAPLFQMVGRARNANPQDSLFDLFITERERLGPPLSWKQKFKSRLVYLALYGMSNALENTLQATVQRLVGTLRNSSARQEAFESLFNRGLSILETGLSAYLHATQEWARNPMGLTREEFLSRALEQNGSLRDLTQKFAHYVADEVFAGFVFFPKLRAYLADTSKWEGMHKLLYYPISLFSRLIFTLADLTTIPLLNAVGRRALRAFAPRLIQSAVKTAADTVSPQNLSLSHTLNTTALRHLHKFHLDLFQNGLGEEGASSTPPERYMRVAHKLAELFRVAPLSSPQAILSGQHPVNHWLGRLVTFLAPQTVTSSIQGLLATALQATHDHLKTYFEEIIGTGIESTNSLYSPDRILTPDELRHAHAATKQQLDKKIQAIGADLSDLFIDETLLGNSPHPEILDPRINRSRDRFTALFNPLLAQLEQTVRVFERPLLPPRNAALAETRAQLELFQMQLSAQDRFWSRLPPALASQLKQIKTDLANALNHTIAALTALHVAPTDEALAALRGQIAALRALQDAARQTCDEAPRISRAKRAIQQIEAAVDAADAQIDASLATAIPRYQAATQAQIATKAAWTKAQIATGATWAKRTAVCTGVATALLAEAGLFLFTNPSVALAGLVGLPVLTAGGLFLGNKAVQYAQEKANQAVDRLSAGSAATVNLLSEAPAAVVGKVRGVIQSLRQQLPVIYATGKETATAAAQDYAAQARLSINPDLTSALAVAAMRNLVTSAAHTA